MKLREHLSRRLIGLAATLVLPLRLTAQDEPPATAGGRPVRLATSQEVLVHLSGYLQVDGRWLSGATQNLPDGILLRRARLLVDAQLPSGWGLRLQPDFGQGRVQVQDAFVSHDQSSRQFRAGRFRPSFGLERSQSSSTLLFPERSIINSLVPSRSLGAQLTWRRGIWTLAAGGFRTPIGTDATVLDTDGDVGATVGSGHDLLLRSAWAWRRDERYADLQVSLLDGRERGSDDAPAMIRILTVGQQPLTAFRNDGTEAGTVVASGSRRRASAGGALGSAQWMLAAEGAWLSQRGTIGSVGGTVTTGAAVLRGTWVWNGRLMPSQEIVPSSRRGAVELGLRAGTIGSWGQRAGALISSRSARRAASGGVALGWTPGALTRLSLGYDITASGDLRSVREHALMARVQQTF
ncbi:porin [Gemmatimonas sp. UBA7669]|uniref:porin n=1 Tax=Gemmatimonas sp. UBA7669 TaxID=1946568 RepID=UPI0025BB5BA5|nr:porin [Gemmatimonas sp. UBA7669]